MVAVCKKIYRQGIRDAFTEWIKPGTKCLFAGLVFLVYKRVVISSFFCYNISVLQEKEQTVVKDKLMLSIYFGNYSGSNYIHNPDLYFDNTYEDEWLEDELSKEMVKDIDRSELVGPNLVISPVLGSIPVTRLSGGVKTLIQIAHDPEHIYNATACGDNCAAWLLRIAEGKDVLVRMGHIMHFGQNENFRIRIANTDEVVTSQSDLTQKVILAGLLDED